MNLLFVSSAPPPELLQALSAQFSITHCANEKEALSLAPELQPDFILIETLLEGCDGFELTRALRLHPSGLNSRVVLLCDTLLSSADHEHALRVGASKLLSRNISPDRLLEYLTLILSTPNPPPPKKKGSLKEWSYLHQSRLQLAKEFQSLQAQKQSLQAEIDLFQENQNQLEQRLRHAQRLGAIGTISSGVAHDFNNILCGIIGLAEIGLRHSQNDPDCHRNFDDIRTASHRASNLARAILSFSRRQEQPRGPIYPSRTLNEALVMLRATIPSFIQIEEEISEVPSQILGEVSQFQQIVTNLILNAWHAIGNHNGQIKVKIHLTVPSPEHLQRLHQLHKKPYVCLQVTDNGSGISPENLERIFDPFFTTKPSGQGTGLGLWVARGIVESWDGVMTVDTTLGKGTTFSIYFPQSHENKETSSLHPPSLPMGHGQKILFVDEEALLASVLSQNLVSLGYAPTVASNLEEAVTLIQSTHFDAVLTDLNMPDTNGIDLARTLWKLKPHLPIILTTGHTDQIDEAGAQSLGFRTLLSKPFDSRTLAQTLHTVLG